MAGTLPEPGVCHSPLRLWRSEMRNEVPRPHRISFPVHPALTVPFCNIIEPSSTSRRMTSTAQSSSPSLPAIIRLLCLLVACFGSANPALAQAPPGGAIEGFQTELFTGAATTDIPIVLPLGVAGVSPQLSLRYSSQAVDELNPWEQGDWAGLGWTLDAGGFIFRDTKGTTTTSDDTFKLIYAGVGYDLILVDSTQNIYHTKDETFLKLTYVSSADYWTLKTKDGTTHRLGFNPDSKAMTLGQDITTPVAYKYLLDQVTTVSGVAVQYSYTKQTATVSSTGRSYDQAVYLDTITYAYSRGALLGPGRQVRFLRQPRSDWTDTSATTSLSFFGNQRLDVIEVSIGGSLVRRYVFGFDYSITRNPNYVWGGGATGDLTLRSVTLYGSDGVSTLPSQTFTYNPAGRLDTVTNGFGGSVSF